MKTKLGGQKYLDGCGDNWVTEDVEVGLPPPADRLTRRTMYVRVNSQRGRRNGRGFAGNGSAANRAGRHWVTVAKFRHFGELLHDL
jgi:hypothetical protein